MSLNDLPKNVVSSVMNFPKEYQSQLFKMALLAHLPTDQDHSHLIKNLSRGTSMPKEQIYNILGVYIAFIKWFLENNECDFNQKLLELGFTTDFLQKLPFFSNPNGIINNLMDNQTDFGKMYLFKWRIDISLSNRWDHASVLSSLVNEYYWSLIPTPLEADHLVIESPVEVLKNQFGVAIILHTMVKKVPMNLLVSLTMKNGKKIKIKIEAKEFHRLRFNVALILKELNSLRLSK